MCSATNCSSGMALRCSRRRWPQSIREPVRRVIETVRFDILRERAFDPASAERTFSLSASDIGELVFLPRLLEQLTVSAPKLNLRSLTMPPAELREAMTTGGVDLAIGYFPDLTGAGFFQQKLFEHAFTCLVRADHPDHRRPDQHEAIPRRRSCRGHAGRPQPGDRRAADGRDGAGSPYRAAVAAFHERAASGGDLQHHFDRAARGRTGLHAHRPAQAAGAALQNSEHRTQAILAPPRPYRPGCAVAEKPDRQALSEPRSLGDGRLAHLRRQAPGCSRLRIRCSGAKRRIASQADENRLSPDSRSIRPTHRLPASPPRPRAASARRAG